MAYQQTEAVSDQLARTAGHVASIKRMVEEGRPGADVLIQPAAVHAASVEVGGWFSGEEGDDWQSTSMGMGMGMGMGMSRGTRTRMDTATIMLTAAAPSAGCGTPSRIRTRRASRSTPCWRAATAVSGR